MQYKILVVSTLAGLASAYFQPDTSKPPSGNAITAPLNQVVPGGKPFKITWTPSTQGQVSILLLKGPTQNVQYLSTIADQVPNSGEYTWNVDPSLAPQDSGYAIEIVAQDRTYQYSTQIGIGKAEGGSKSGSDSSTGSGVVTYGGVETAPPSSGAEGTAECGALAECPKTGSSSASATSQYAPMPTAGAATGTGNISSPIVTPTKPITMPSNLVTAGAPGQQTSISTAVVATGVGASGGAASSVAPTGGAVSSALAAPGAKLSGAAALVAGFIGLLAL